MNREMSVLSVFNINFIPILSAVGSDSASKLSTLDQFILSFILHVGYTTVLSHRPYMCSYGFLDCLKNQLSHPFDCILLARCLIGMPQLSY